MKVKVLVTAAVAGLFAASVGMAEMSNNKQDSTDTANAPVATDASNDAAPVRKNDTTAMNEADHIVADENSEAQD